MTKHELPKAYDFRSTEPRIYEMWEAGGYFKPWNDPNNPDFDPSIEPFVISIPPPNVTGELHLGHAMFVSVEDLMTRYHRMKGFSTLWLPGTDHAGIATQLMVERDLLKTEEVTREELGREAFVERTWEWKRKYGDIITTQDLFTYQFQGEGADGKLRGNFQPSGIRPAFLPRAEYYGLDRALLEVI